MWTQQGRHRTETTGDNSLHPIQQRMDSDDEEDISGANIKHIRSGVSRTHRVKTV